MKKISDLEAFLIDLDGTIYLGDKVISGAPEFFDALRQKGIKFLILSNNSSMSCRAYQTKLKQFGIKVSQNEVLTSTIAAIDYLENFFPCAKVFPVGTTDFEAELHEHGIRLTENDEADIVLLGFDTTLTYEKIKKASKLIRKGANFIATHEDVLCPTEEGFIPDIGSLIPLFEKATGISPIIIGKPHHQMIESALSRLNMKSDFVGMIGDRLYMDIKMANIFGLTSILVLSGETSTTDLLDCDIIPQYVFPSVREIIPVL